MAQDVIETQLAGKPLQSYPFFQYVQSINENASIYVAIDPSQFPNTINQEFNLHIVAAKSKEEWQINPGLVDVRPIGAQTLVIKDSTIQENTFLVAGAYVLPSKSGSGLGVAYDVVFDMDQNGLLSSGDFIDGFSNKEAGFYLVHDTSLPGPLNVNMIEYSGGTWLNQRTFYPSNIESMGELPLVVISHGWYLEYTDYDHIANHLASYGYIVMTHTNAVGNGGPSGTRTAAGTLLDNTDYIIGNQDTIGGGVLNNHINSDKIVWIGQSTGGECVVRAYTLLRRVLYDPQYFDYPNIVLICSIAPVCWHSEFDVSPYDINYHMFVGGADGDASGAPLDNYVQSMAIFERSTGNHHLTYIHGAGHSDFDSSPSPPDYWVEGPDLIGREATYKVVNGYYLPLIELYTKNNEAARDFFTRMYDDFHPIGIPDNVIIAQEYHENNNREKFVVDDFEINSEIALSSSGGIVSYNISNISEVLMQDIDGSFDWAGAQPSNGMTRARFDDDPHCVVFDWTVEETKYYELEILQEYRDFSEYQFLSFRAAQGTRHPETVALDDKLNFTVTLRDDKGISSSINFVNYGQLTYPYRRTGYGTGAGWGNEFSTVRIRLRDFLTNNSGLDLGKIEAIRFEFGSDYGSERGRIGIDDIELVSKVDTGEIDGIHGDNSVYGIIAKFNLDQNYPNPFNPLTTIEFTLPKSEHVELKVYNILGKEVATLVSNKLNQGNHTYTFDSKNLASGIYYYQLVAGDFREVKKMILIK
jgi:hypothetical protein